MEAIKKLSYEMEIRDIFDVAQHFQMNLLVDYSFIFINSLIVFILINHLKLFCPLLLLKNLHSSCLIDFRAMLILPVCLF